MVQGPTIAAAYNVRDSLFPINQDPPARVVGIYLLAWKQLRVVCDQLLKDVFQVEFLFAHRLKLTIVFQNVDFIGQLQVPPFQNLWLDSSGLT